MSRLRAIEADIRGAADRLETLGAWLPAAERWYFAAGLAAGQVADSAHDDALFLLLRTLGLDLDTGPRVFRAPLSAAQRRRLRDTFLKRVIERVPTAYLVREAWLGGLRFHVDERAIIPRSFFVEIIPRLRGDPRRIVDIGTGSGCLAILLARRFPKARVDAVDVSASALAVARINVREHGLSGRIRLFKSDVFDSVPKGRYDLIASNPPYERSARVAALPREFKREPKGALDGGKDGLAVIRKLLGQAPERLEPGGRVLIEVGGLRRAIDREFSALRPRWLGTRDGSDCVAEFVRIRTEL